VVTEVREMRLEVVAGAASDQLSLSVVVQVRTNTGAGQSSGSTCLR
jgi:hypothetical protein